MLLFPELDAPFRTITWPRTSSTTQNLSTGYHALISAAMRVRPARGKAQVGSGVRGLFTHLTLLLGPPAEHDTSVRYDGVASVPRHRARRIAVVGAVGVVGRGRSTR